MIISRYLIKEIASTLFGVTFVLLIIFLSHQLVRFLGMAASGKFAVNILLQLMGFEIPYLLALLLPLGLYLGIILAFGRLYADSEMRVLHACGVSESRLLKITSSLIILVAVLVLILMCWVNPWIANQKNKLIAHSLTTENILNTLMPGRFQVSRDGKRVVYVEKIARNHKQAENLFIAEAGKVNPETQNRSWTVVSAAQGAQVTDNATRSNFMVAADGYRYEGSPGQNAYKIIQFKKYSIKVPQTIIENSHQRHDAVATSALWKDYQQKPLYAAELQWRLSISLAVILLGFLAIPLSHVKPRHGKYSQLLPAILIYIVYFNLLFVCRDWIEEKVISPIIGVWWVHLLLLGLAVTLMMLQARVFRRRST